MSNLDNAIAALKAANMIVSQNQQSNSVQANQQRNYMQDLSKTIKEERLKQGLTQCDLAKMAGYSQGTIARAETNLWISIFCLVSIFEALGKKILLINK